MAKKSLDQEVDSLLKEKDTYQARAKKLLASLDKEIAALQAKRDSLAAMLGGSAPKTGRGRPKGSTGTRKTQAPKKAGNKRVTVSKADLKALLAQGMTSKQIAAKFGVATITVSGWKNKFGLTKKRAGKKATRKTAKRAATKKRTSRRSAKKAPSKKARKAGTKKKAATKKSK